MIDYHTLKGWSFPTIEHTYTADDSMFYALAVGLGADPMDERQLAFVNDTAPGMPLALPTMAVILGYPGPWMRDSRTGIDFGRVVHGEESIVLLNPLKASGTIVSRHRVTHVVDKGAGKGAIVIYDKELLDKATGEKLASVTQTTFCRGDGGFSMANGLTDTSPQSPPKVPQRTRSRLRVAHSAAAGAALSLVCGPQPAALRAGRSPQGRLRSTDPTRT